MINGLFLEGISKQELLSAVRVELSDHFLVLLTTAEAADLIGVSTRTVNEMKNDGRLTDYSEQNERRKFAVSEVLKIRRIKDGRRP